MKNRYHYRFYSFLTLLVFIFQNTLSAQNCANNLIQNPGFEADLSNWAGSGGVIATAPNVVSGTKSLKLCNLGDMQRQTLSASAGKTYQFRYTAKTAGINQNVLFGIKFLSSSWQVLATEYTSFDSPAGFTSNSIQKLAPTGTTWVEVSINKENAGCVYVDDLCLTDAPQVSLGACFTEKQISAQNIAFFDETANEFSIVNQLGTIFTKNEFDKEGNLLGQTQLTSVLPVLTTQTSITVTNVNGVSQVLTGKIYNLPNNEKVVTFPLVLSPTQTNTKIYCISPTNTIIVGSDVLGNLTSFLVNPFDNSRFLFKSEEIITNTAGVNVVNYETEKVLTLSSDVEKTFKLISKLTTPTGLQTQIIYRRFLPNGNVLTYSYLTVFNSVSGNTTTTQNEVIVQNANTTLWQSQLPDNFAPFKQFHLLEKPNNKILGVGLLTPNTPQTPEPSGNIWIYNCKDLNGDCAYGLVGHYTFDGDATDKSGKQNNGIVNGATLTTDRNGVANKAYNFDGNDYIEVPNSASISSPNNQITIAGWVLNNNPNGAFALLCKSDLGFMDYRLQYYGNGRNELELLLDGGVVGLNYIFPIGEWFHVAVTGNSGVYKFYKDGVLIGTKNEIPNIVAINKVTNLYLGFDPHNVAEYHLGKLDEIRVYDCALTEAEVLAIYNAEKPVPTSTCSNNLLQNAGFESDLNNWTGFGGTIGTAPNVATGLKSLKLCTTGEIKQQLLPATAGKTYKLQFTAKTAGTNQNVLFGIKFLSASWQPLATEYTSFDSPTGFTTNFIQKLAPTGTVWVEVSVIKQNAGCVYIDDLCLTDGGVVSNPKPDLTISNLTISNLTLNVATDSYAALYTNIGSVDAISTPFGNTIETKIYVSTDAIWSPNDFYSGSSGGAGTIQAGATFGLNGGFLFTLGQFPPGTYYLIAVIDPTNAIDESDETNNTKAVLFQLVQGNNGADLEITMTANKTTVALWNEVTYTITAKNNGNAPITSAVVQIGGCSNGTILAFNNNSLKLVYTGIPNAPTVGNYEYISQVWTINNLAAGQQGVLTLKLFLTGAGEKKVIAYTSSQSPNDLDSQPYFSAPFNCIAAQDDEAHWTINQGQQLLASGVRAEDYDTAEEILFFQKIGFLDDYTLFPNPATEMVYIKMSSPTSDGVTLVHAATTVKLLNQLGKVEKVQEFSSINEEGIHEFSLQDISNGVYFMQIETAGQRAVVRKLVVSRMY
jgi:Concanavalin A-like lectin/glucanases superfamily/Secretion system C-terminal sorting domain/Domain of unknown function DUF11/CARDB